jgi:hypothetical protein
MSRKRALGKGSGLPKSGGTNDFGVEFVSIHLSDEDKDVIRHMDVDIEGIFGWIQRWLDDGYKISCSYDLHNSCFIFSMTGGKLCTVKENVGRCLVSRGSSPEQAFFSCLYKIKTYCPNDLFPTIVQEVNPDIS